MSARPGERILRLLTRASWRTGNSRNSEILCSQRRRISVAGLRSVVLVRVCRLQRGSAASRLYCGGGPLPRAVGSAFEPYRIQWSGLNATTTWTSGTNSSDFQDFPDGGIVRGVAGGEYGIVFQDQAIRRMSYVPGSPIIFQIDRITQDKGLFAPYSIIRAGERIFFYAGQGFHKIEPGGVPQQIGREKVDRTFLADLDKGNLQLFMGAADPRSTRVYWAYKSVSGATGAYDRLLGYDFLLDRFFPVSASGEYLLGISQTGLTLENLDSISKLARRADVEPRRLCDCRSAGNRPVQRSPRPWLFPRREP